MNRIMPPAPPEPLYILRGHRAAVQCVAFLPDSKALAAGDAEGELKIWDLDSQRPASSIRAHASTSGILQVACPTSHPWVISQGRDGVVKVWELQPGYTLSSQPIQQLSSGCFNFCRFALLEPGQTSSSCSISSSSSQQPAAAPAASVSQPADIPALVVVNGFAAAAVDAEPGPADHDTTACASSSTSVQVGTGDGSGKIQQQQQPAVQGLLSQQIRQAQQQQQQQQVADVTQQSTNPSVQGQDVDSHTQCVTPAAAAAAAAAVHSTPADTAPDDLTHAAEEQLMTRNTAAEAAAAADSLGDTSSAATPAAAAAAAAGGPCYLALPSDDPANVGIWELAPTAAAAGASGSQRPQVLLAQSKGPDQPHRGQCMAVVLLRPQGSHLHVLTGYEDGSIALWNTRNSSTYLAAQRLHLEPVMCLAAAPNCSSGFTGSADDKLATFEVDITKGQLRVGPHLNLPQEGLADVAIRPDGRIAATAGWDAKVRVWHCKKRQPLAILKWHSQQVACVGFSRDSVLLAAGGRDNFISMWSLYPPE